MEEGAIYILKNEEGSNLHLQNEEGTITMTN